MRGRVDPRPSKSAPGVARLPASGRTVSAIDAGGREYLRQMGVGTLNIHIALAKHEYPSRTPRFHSGVATRKQPRSNRHPSLRHFRTPRGARVIVRNCSKVSRCTGLRLIEEVDQLNEQTCLVRRSLRAPRERGSRRPSRNHRVQRGAGTAWHVSDPRSPTNNGPGLAAREALVPSTLPE